MEQQGIEICREWMFMNDDLQGGTECAVVSTYKEQKIEIVNTV